MWAHACHFTDDQVFEAALVTLITTSQSRISHDAFLSQWLPKFWSLGPIRGLLRALARYHPICTVKKKKTLPINLSLPAAPPEYTNALRSQPWTNVLARPVWFCLRGRIQWWDGANTPGWEFIWQTWIHHHSCCKGWKMSFKCSISEYKRATT